MDGDELERAGFTFALPDREHGGAECPTETCEVFRDRRLELIDFSAGGDRGVNDDAEEAARHEG